MNISEGKLKTADGDILVKTLPIGIEPRDFSDRLKKDEVQNLIECTRGDFRDMQIMVGVDRLDYIKGIPLKLEALDKLFQQHPEKVGKVVLIQVVVPSRENVQANQSLRKDVQELVGKINGKYGRPDPRWRICAHGESW